MKKKGEWLLVHGENYMSIQPEFCCSVCTDVISTYDPPKECRKCGAVNEYKGNSTSVKMVCLTSEEIETIRIGIDVAQFECQLQETEESESIRNLLTKLGLYGQQGNA